MHFLRSLAGSALFVASCAAVASCGITGIEVDGTVLHAAPETRGHVLFVTLYRQSELGSDGFPQAPSGNPPTLVLLKRLDDASSDYTVEIDKGCLPEIRLLAWIDVNDTTGFAAMMEEGEALTPDLHDPRFDLGSIARPDKGDWIALSAQIEAPAGEGECKPASFDAELEPAPTN